MARVKWSGFIHKQSTLNGTSKLVTRKFKVCPVCLSTYFEASYQPGFHPLARYYCKKHRGFFFMPKTQTEIIRK